MNILQLIAADSFIMTNKRLIKLFGLYEANLIGLFASLSNYNYQINPKFDGWFYLTYERIEDELGLSDYVAKKPLDNLVKSGILFEKKEGIPFRKFFKFNEQKLLDCLLPRNSGTGNLETRRQEVEDLVDQDSSNSTTSSGEASEQDSQKLGRNNNTFKNKSKNKYLLNFLSLPSEEKKDFLRKVWEEKKYKSSYEEYFIFREKSKKQGWDSIGSLEADFAWWENGYKKKHPEVDNPVVKDSLTTQTFKISDLTIKIHEISRILHINADYFVDRVGKLTKTENGFLLIPVKDFDCEKWGKALENMNVKIEVK